MLQFYKDMVNYYNQSAIARKGINTFYPHDDVICIKKTLNNEEVIILVNLRPYLLVYLIPNELQNTSWMDVFTNDQVDFQNVIQMDPYQYLILKQ